MQKPTSSNHPPEHLSVISAVDLEAVYYRLLEIARDLDELEACSVQDSSAAAEVTDVTD